MQKRFDDLTITDDYMFCAVMQDKSICTTVLNMILADSIGQISDISYQKPLTKQAMQKAYVLMCGLPAAMAACMTLRCKLQINKTLLNAYATINRLST